MATWAKWLLGVFGVLVLVVVVLVVVFDWNWLRQPASNFASKAMGRDIEIGNVEGQWRLTPRVTIRDVHIANVDWAKDPEMIAADEISFVIDLKQLLRGRTVLPELTLVKPKVVLEKDKQGRSNWNFAARQAADTVAPDERSEMPLIGHLRIEDGRLIYRDPKAGLDIDGQISSAEGTGGEKGEGSINFKGTGKLQGEAFKISMQGGSLLSLREETDKPYPLTIDVDAVGSHAKVSGTLKDPIKFDGLDLKVALKGPDLSRLTKITGVPFPITPDYDLTAKALERDGNVWTFRGVDGTMGHSDLHGDIKYDARKDRPYIEANLNSKVLDYRDVGTLIGVDPEKIAAEKKAAEQAAENKKQNPSAVETVPPKVLPDAPLSVAQVRNVDAKVHFKGDKVEAPNVPLSGVEMNLTLDHGLLKLEPLDVGIAGGTTSSFIRIDARKEQVETDYDIALRGYRLEHFLDEAGLKDKGEGRIDGRIKLNGVGDTVAKSLATANGQIRLVMDDGQVSNLGLEIAGLDVAESAEFLAKGDQKVPIRCFVSDFQVKDGAVWPQLFVFDTTDTLLTADGGFNLKDESLNLRISAHPKDTSPVALRTPITIKGYFAKPSIGVDKGPLVAKAGAAVALGALLTPLASILAFIDPGLAKDSDCNALLQQTGITQ
jgi:uncharacterized protein involved in outer membrane biogenesis